MNLISILGVYATLSRELGLPLRFPGKPGAFTAISQTTDAGLLARAMTFIATSAVCANQAFNITNGDFFRYQNLWPLARSFRPDAGSRANHRPADIHGGQGAIVGRPSLRVTACNRRVLPMSRTGILPATPSASIGT